jgi:hypothetical protein
MSATRQMKGIITTLLMSAMFAACGDAEIEQLPLVQAEVPDVASACDDSTAPAALSFTCGLQELPRWFQQNCGSQLSPVLGCTAGGRAQSSVECRSFGETRQTALGTWPTEGSGDLTSVLVRVDELRFGPPPDELFDRYAGYFSSVGCTTEGRRAALDGVTSETFTCSGWVGYTELRPESNTVSGFWAGAARNSARLCIEAP